MPNIKQGTTIELSLDDINRYIREGINRDYDMEYKTEDLGINFKMDCKFYESDDVMKHHPEVLSGIVFADYQVKR